MSAMPPPSSMGDAWYESEQPTRRGLAAELQRIRRRTRVRPLPVLALAALITGAITYKIAIKPQVFEAEVVLMLAEGSMAGSRTGIPVDELRAYVTGVLLPDKKLLELIEKYDLTPLRHKAGPEFALDRLRGQFSVDIWKNSFVNYDEEDEKARRSARIGITVTDADPDRAIDLAHDLAATVIESAASVRQAAADRVSEQIEMMHKAAQEEVNKLETKIEAKAEEIDQARRRGQTDVAGILGIDLATLQAEQRSNQTRLNRIVASPEALASQVAAAGLDLSLSVVDENRPERPTHSGMVLVMIAAVIGTGSLIGSALVLGAFDSRVHEADDVTRLGLPVLGHVPGFAGDNVGSMLTRSATHARVPSFQRWRFHR
ncbi:MAG TPA: hypothetical protein VF469_01540 [Kofleriaceae bacterium]